MQTIQFKNMYLGIQLRKKRRTFLFSPFIWSLKIRISELKSEIEIRKILCWKEQCLPSKCVKCLNSQSSSGIFKKYIFNEQKWGGSFQKIFVLSANWRRILVESAMFFYEFGWLRFASIIEIFTGNFLSWLFSIHKEKKW